jgi:hypothetical protein
MFEVFRQGSFDHSREGGVLREFHVPGVKQKAFCAEQA